MSYFGVAPFVIFETSALLGNGATYDSGVLDLRNWQQVQTHVLSDVNGTVVVDFIRDSGGTDVLRTLTIPYIGGSGYQTFSAPAFTPYVRYRFTADEAGQTDFYFNTKVLKTSLSGQVLATDAFISPLMVANLGRNIIVGKTSGGRYNNVAIEPVTDRLQISVPKTSFGELEVASPTPVVQSDFVYNVNSDVVDTATTGSGTVTQADAMVNLQTGAAASSSAEVCTKRLAKYRPGQGVQIRGTAIFTTGVANSIQLFGAGDDVNGVFFGYDGADFGILRRSNSVDTWTAQADWNGDVMDGSGSASNPSGRTLDPTQGNVYQIKFQWLGFGKMVYGIEDEITGDFIPVHSIRYANNNTVPSLYNPTFPVCWYVENTTNTTNLTVKGASCYAAVEGKIEYLGPRNSVGNTKTGVSTLTNILTIRNKTSFASKTNRTPINISKFTVAVDGTKTSEYQVILNATLGGTPSYTDISTNTSVVDYDTAGTTITGGSNLDFGALGKTDSTNVIPDIADIILYPGDTLTIAVSSSANTDATAAIRWVEDF
jgi:hypothetical protein